MNLLIIGSGAREHAFAWKIFNSKHIVNLFITNPNPGTAKIAKSIYNEKIENACALILKKLDPQGPFNVQCVIDDKKSQVFIFEINPRFSTSTTLTVASGLDEINLIIDMAIGKKVNLNKKNWDKNVMMIRNHTDYFSNKYEFN